MIFLEKVGLMYSSLVLCTERPKLSLSKLWLEPGTVQFVCAQESDLFIRLSLLWLVSS